MFNVLPNYSEIMKSIPHFYSTRFLYTIYQSVFQPNSSHRFNRLSSLTIALAVIISCVSTFTIKPLSIFKAYAG